MKPLYARRWLVTSFGKYPLPVQIGFDHANLALFHSKSHGVGAIPGCSRASGPQYAHASRIHRSHRDRLRQAQPAMRMTFEIAASIRKLDPPAACRPS